MYNTFLWESHEIECMESQCVGSQTCNNIINYKHICMANHMFMYLQYQENVLISHDTERSIIFSVVAGVLDLYSADHGAYAAALGELVCRVNGDSDLGLRTVLQEACRLRGLCPR